MRIFVIEEENIECAHLDIPFCFLASAQHLQTHDNEDSPIL